MPSTKKFYLGPLAAQDDPDILKYFYESSQVKQLLEGSVTGPTQFIIVSRPGAGKSALFEWVANSQNRLSALIVRGANHRIIPSDASMNVDDYRTLAFGEFATAFIMWTSKHLDLGSETMQRIGGFRRKKVFTAVKSFFGEDFLGLNILGCGFNLSERERRDYLKELRSADYQHQLEAIIKQITSQAHPVIIFDDPEFTIAEGLDELSPPNAQRLGGLLSALGRLDALGVGTLAFVRENIYRAVVDHYHDASHFADRIQGLGWTEEDLLELIRLRLERRVAMDWASAFGLSEKELTQLVFPFLVNGPRDLIRICNFAGNAAIPISYGSLERAIEQTSRDRWSETWKQFSSLLPSFDRFAGAALRAIERDLGSDKIDPHALETLIQNELTKPGSDIHNLRNEDWVDALPFQPRRAVDLLYSAGCLGYYEGRKRVYPWAGRSTEMLALSDSYFLSPAFTRTLR